MSYILVFSIGVTRRTLSSATPPRRGRQPRPEYTGQALGPQAPGLSAPTSVRASPGSATPEFATGKRCRDPAFCDRANDALFGENAPDEFRGGYIEGRAVAVHVGWGRRRSEATADFIRVALLDGNPRTIGGGWVKRTTRSRDVERHAVGPGEDGDAVGADLVGHVAVGGDPVGPGDDQIDPARLHQRADHAVAQQG